MRAAGTKSRRSPILIGFSHAESQRDSGLQPRVARNELPWESVSKAHNPNGVVAWRRRRDATPLGLKNHPAVTQGSSFLATLGWRTQPRWGCRELADPIVVAGRFPVGWLGRGGFF